MTQTITLRVNGKERTVEVPVQRLLIDCLRYDLGLTGTKEGCSVGVCGACTVLMDGQMISSCLTLAVLAVAAALLPVLLTLKRVALRAESVLLLLEQEIRPMATQLQVLAEELRTLSRQASRELDRVGAVAGRVDDLSRRIGKVVGLVGSMTRVGQFVGAATGVKKGLDVFIAKLLTKNRGQ